MFGKPITQDPKSPKTLARLSDCKQQDLGSQPLLELLTLPDEILIRILYFLIKSSLRDALPYLLICTKIKKFILDDFFNPNNFLKKVTNHLVQNDIYCFLRYYRNSSHYSAILKKTADECSNEEYVCYAIAVEDINFLSLSRLEKILKSDFFNHYGDYFKIQVGTLVCILEGIQRYHIENPWPFISEINNRLNIYLQHEFYLNLAGADLSKLCLSGTKLINVNLTKANLTYSNLVAVECDKANFTNADFSGAIVNKTKFKTANLTDAKFNDCQFFDMHKYIWGSIFTWDIKEELTEISANFDLNEHLKLAISQEIVSILQNVYLPSNISCTEYLDIAIEFFKQHESKPKEGIVSSVIGLFTSWNVPAHLKLLNDLKNDIDNGKFKNPELPIQSRRPQW